MADTIPGSTASTQTLAIGDTASSIIDYVGDTDWWKVYLVQGYQYQVWLEGLTANAGTLADPLLRVYGGGGVFLFGNDENLFGGHDAYVSVLPLGSDPFFLSAEESGNNATGSYKLTIWLDQLDSVSSRATIPFNSASPPEHLGWQTDFSDWFAVTLTAGVQYQFDLIGSANDGALSGLTLFDPLLFLRNSAGALITSNQDAGLGGNSRIFYTPSTSGTYFLDAQESGHDAFGLYRLIVNSPAGSTGLTLGVAQTGSIDFQGDVNLHSLSLTAGTKYAFAVDGISLADPCVEVLDGAGTTVAFDDDGGAGQNAYLVFTPSTSGTYFLAARDSGNNGLGSYSARVWQLPTVSISNATVIEGNTASVNLVFPVTLSAPSTTPVTVDVMTSGTATASYDRDYMPTVHAVTFAPGQTSTTFSVQVRGDTEFEPTEALHVLLYGAVGAALDDADAFGYIVDNDSPYSLPTDAFLGEQWYLYPRTGINVFPVWADYTGSGVRVAVFDQGIDPSHPELDLNLLTSLGRKAGNLSAGGAPILATDNHGTAVAGTIAAERNASGMVGVSYGAGLVSIYSQYSVAEIANALTYAGNFDVLNNSWGFAPQGSDYYSLYGDWAFTDNFSTARFSAAGAALANLAATGRHGLGTVVVQSAGNSFGVGDDTNLHNFQNSQYIITVAATDYAGKVTGYSSPGASVLVAAPGGGGTDTLSDIFTTDRTGAAGVDPGDYTRIAGTSFSAPIVSGVVALMLEANPNLGYRDVQEILAYSARKTDAVGNDWEYNGASNWNGGGLHFDDISHNLGFGLVDARAAVRLAETWSSTPHVSANRQQVSVSRSPALAVSDTGGLAMDLITITQAIDVERVEVTLNVTHPFIGDLGVLLVAPSGTTSFLLWRPQQNPLSAYGTDQNNIHFTFDTVLNWGEGSVGTWGLGIFDEATGFSGSFDSWTLNLIGKPAAADDVYIYTDEFAEAATDQTSRQLLSDLSGVDTLNAAACSAALVLNLVAGGVSTIDGRNLTIALDTTIENAYAGDGSDTVTGNSIANSLYGMRGDDRIQGAGGNDTLDGGAGNDTAVYAGARSQYQVTRTATGYTISGPDGMDTLTGIEWAKFDDQILALPGSAANHPPTGYLSISGTPAQGQTLSVVSTLADGDGLGTISYQWLAAGISIGGATSGAFTLTLAEVGKPISVVARYTDALGNAESMTSDLTVAVLGANATASMPVKAWTRLLGGSKDDIAEAVTIGLDGSVYVSGRTQGSIDGVTSHGGQDGFLTKYSAEGNRTWTRLIGSSDLDNLHALSTGLDGSIYVCGSTWSSLDGQTHNGFVDAYLTKYLTDGAIAWTRLLGTPQYDVAYALTTGLDGSIIVGGNTDGALDGQTSGGDTDAFVTKYAVDGTKAWTRQFGTPGDDRTYALTTGLDGSIFVAGRVGGNLDGQTSVGLDDAFLTKYSADGTKAWTRLLGSSGDDCAYATATGLDGSIYVSGYAAGTMNGQTNAGAGDAFLAKYSVDGAVVWTRLIGSKNYDISSALTIGVDGSIYLTGYTHGPLDGQTNAGGDDAFVTKFSTDGVKAWTRLIGASNLDAGFGLATGLDGSIFVAGHTVGSLDGQAPNGGYDAFLTKFQVLSLSPLIGTSAADHLNSRTGAESIDGAEGTDTVLYATSRLAHQVTKSSDGFVVTNTVNGDVDSLQSVERLDFADARVALDMAVGQSGANTALLLGAVLGHDALAAKKPLVGTVINLFDQGMTMQQLSGAAMRLPIWGLLTNGGPTASNTEIANYLLTTVNGVAPDAQTLSSAVASLNAETGAMQGNFLWHLAESAANQVQVGLVGLMQSGLEFTL